MIFGEEEDKLQTPLADWYTGFPDPSINLTTGEGGWLQCDFKGVITMLVASGVKLVDAQRCPASVVKHNHDDANTDYPR